MSGLPFFRYWNDGRFFLRVIHASLIALLYLLLFLTHSLLPGTLFADGGSALSSRRAVFYTNGDQRMFALDAPYRIHLQSLRVQLNGVTLSPDSTYVLHQLPPRIELTATPQRGSMLVVHYTPIPIPLQTIYLHRQRDAVSLAVADSVSRPLAVVALQARVPSYSWMDTESDFEKSGSLTRGFTVGTNRGVQLNSGLRLQLHGTISDDLEVIASLTDENSPLQPEGNTKSLSEIDKVFFQVRNSHFETTLGDYNLDLEGTRFSSYHRKLEGVSATTTFGSQKTLFSAASTQGEFHINKFLGQEGNQGPYQLAGRTGIRDIVVVGGTEKVWIDGRQMTRGETNDYVIEYASGEVTFTRRRLITGDSRIEVEFQYFTGRFKKNFLSFRTEGAGAVPNLQYRFTFLRESDGDGDPLGFALQESHAGFLPKEDFHDDTDVGVAYRGPGRGDYVRVDSLGIILYRYVGNNRGDYHPTFTAVGLGRGDYDRTVTGVFLFVGKGDGAYLPIAAPEMKRQQNLTDLELQFSHADWFRLSSEVAVSRLQEARILDDTQTGMQGGAVHLTAALSPANMRLGSLPLGAASVTALYSNRGQSFREMSRTRGVEYNRKWDIRDEESSGERTVELQGSYQPFGSLNVLGGLGRLQSGQGMSSNRESLGLVLGDGGNPLVEFHHESVSSVRDLSSTSGDWIRQWGQAGFTKGGFRPHVEFERESKRERFTGIPNGGFGFRRWSGGFSYARNTWLKLDASMERRDDDRFLTDRFADDAVAQTHRVAVTVRPGGGFSSTNSFIRRNKKFTDGRDDATTTLTDMILSYRPARRYLNVSANFQVSQERTPQREEVYLDVGEGRGDYSYDAVHDEYIPDPFGNFIRRTFTANSFQAVRGLKLGSTLDFSARRLLRRRKGASVFYRLVQGISTRTILRLEQQHNIDASTAGAPPALAGFQGGRNFLDYSSFRQDITFLDNVPDMEFRMRLHRGNRVSFEIVDRAEARKTREYSVRFRTRFLTRFGYQLDVGQYHVSRDFATRSRSVRDISSNRLESALFFNPRRNLEYAFTVQVARERDRAEARATRVGVLGLKPSVTYSMANRGRFTGEAGWFRVTASNGLRVLPFELAEGRRPGTSSTWRLHFQYRVSEHLTSNVEYFGERTSRFTGQRERIVTLHQARAEIRAFF